jgi:hypothetical protein
MARGFNIVLPEPALPLVPVLPLVPELPVLPPVLLPVPPVAALPKEPELPSEPELPLAPTGPEPLAPPLPASLSPMQIASPAQISASSAWLTSTPVAHATAPPKSAAAAPHAQRDADGPAKIRCWGPENCAISSLIPQPDQGGSPNSSGRREAGDRAVRNGVSSVLIRCTSGARRLSALLVFAALSACGAKKHPPLAGPGEPSELPGTGGSLGEAGDGGGGGAAGSSPTGSAGALNRSGSGGAAGSGPEEPSCIPRQECQRFCAAFGNDPSSCGLGDSSQCGCICEQRFNSPCPNELTALLACAGATPSVDCASRGRIFPGCERESFDLELCDFRGRERLCAQSYPRCQPYCEAAVLGFCSLGPENVTSCLCGCEASLVTRCETYFDAFMDCSADAPAFACDADGRSIPTTCLSEWQALSGCLDGSPPDAGN